MNPHNGLRFFGIAAAWFVFPPVSTATQWNLLPDGSGDAPTIQAAFDLASAGDEILLAPGTYTGSNTRLVADWTQTVSTSAIAFMKAGVHLIGTGGAAVTFLDGEDLRHCLVGADLGSVEIRGITFYRGRPSGGGLCGVGGGGVIIFRSVATVEHCVFSYCIAPRIDRDGASGLYFIQGSSGVVRFNLFVDCFGGDIGGAAGILEHTGGLVENNTFVRNGAGDGGGAIEINDSTVELNRNIFADNSAARSAGAILCLHETVLTGSCNVFWNNTAPIDNHMTLSCSFVGSNENILADPYFCGPLADNFLIRADSPAAPTDPSGCGLRGAFGVGCGSVSLEPTSWGRLKALYR